MGRPHRELRRQGAVDRSAGTLDGARRRRRRLLERGGEARDPPRRSAPRHGPRGRRALGGAVRALRAGPAGRAGRARRALSRGVLPRQRPRRPERGFRAGVSEGRLRARAFRHPAAAAARSRRSPRKCETARSSAAAWSAAQKYIGAPMRQSPRGRCETIVRRAAPMGGATTAIRLFSPPIAPSVWPWLWASAAPEMMLWMVAATVAPSRLTKMIANIIQLCVAAPHSA